MIAFNNCADNVPSTWQDGFVQILPELAQRLHRAFRELDAESRDDATENGIVHCLLSYIRLFERGTVRAIRPSSLAWYAALQVRRGRQAACRLNGREPLSRYAQVGKNLTVERLQSYCPATGEWIDSLIDDRSASVADQVALRMDLRAWLVTLSQRTRRIAKDLAYGFSTAEMARKYCLSASRISQLRRELERSWSSFQGQNALADSE
jgi:hypothetical protein